MANSVTARFNDNCKVHVAMSDDATVTKAVIIDAEGNETDIGGGGGSSDFSTATVTYETDQLFPLYMARADDLMEGLNPSVKTDGEYIVPLYKGKAFAIWPHSIEDLEIKTTGDITYDSEHNNVFIITGDGTISIF